MPKKIILILLIICIYAVYADDLDEKVKELQQLQNQLKAAEESAKQTAKKKQQTESEIKRTSSLKKQTDQKLNRYRLQERVLRDSLNQVEMRLNKADQRLMDYQQALSRELNLLLRVDRSYSANSVAHRDHRYLSNLARQNNRSIQVLKGFKASLEDNKYRTNREATLANRNLRTEARRSTDYNRQINRLNTESKNLSAQEKKLQNQIAQLKKDAASLQGLIDRLVVESGKKPSSYQFTQIKIAWPVRGSIIRTFGQEMRSYGTSVVSNGIDIAVREGTDVLAVDDGEVVFADRYGGQGKLIIIDHKNGFFSLYAYNSDLLVQSGAQVNRGQKIAKSGMTGSANEPSLHFELRKDGKAINPIPYFE